MGGKVTVNPLLELYEKEKKTAATQPTPLPRKLTANDELSNNPLLTLYAEERATAAGTGEDKASSNPL